MIGPGKYDELCATALRRSKARAVLMILIDGYKGNGVSCKGTIDGMLNLPALLRAIADEIESDSKQIAAGLED